MNIFEVFAKFRKIPIKTVGGIGFCANKHFFFKSSPKIKNALLLRRFEKNAFMVLVRLKRFA